MESQEVLIRWLVLVVLPILFVLGEVIPAIWSAPSTPANPPS